MGGVAHDASLTDFGTQDDPETARSDGSAPDRPSGTAPESEPTEGSSSGSAESTADGGARDATRRSGDADGDATRRSGDADGDATAGSEAVADEIGRTLTTTYAVTGDDRSCDRCGAKITRRWRDDGALVCVDCKDW
jgi:hypothetical protein